MIDWDEYQLAGTFDETVGDRKKRADRPAADRGSARARYGSVKLAKTLASFSDEELQYRKAALELAIKEMGITFTVYGEGEGSIDRSWPLDLIPRIIIASEWREIERGLIQRVRALNLFIQDLYHEQRTLVDGVVPESLVADSANYLAQCRGISPPFGVWAHICGSDLVRGADGVMYVLEDNLRIPSGVSYLIENRKVMKRVLPELFSDYSILPVDDYPSHLFDTLAALSPQPAERPQVVILTPGIYNSAYFEHAFLAQQMGCELVEGQDLVVGRDDRVYMHTIRGLERVDVIYRRVDDLFLDPEVFREDSALGVPGLIRAWQAGNVGLANAPGAGVADDKAVYTYVPDIIRYFLGEEPLLQNVPTWKCENREEREYVLGHLDELVVKPVNASGGHGLMIGPGATGKEIEQMASAIKQQPRNYIGQPVVRLSTVPTLAPDGVQPRHVDLRPFVLSSDKVLVTSGGLTRVAMRKGSLVVNSSMGGGSKDTWIVDDEDL